jgi:hypothetical protein
MIEWLNGSPIDYFILDVFGYQDQVLQGALILAYSGQRESVLKSKCLISSTASPVISL